METLPAEIRSKIYTCLSDLASVKNLSETCTAFHEVFSSAKDAILRAVVLNCIDHCLLREIWAVSKSLQMTTWSRQAVIGIIDLFCEFEFSTIKIEWDMPTSLEIYRLQKLVHDFTADFALITLSRSCVTPSEGTSCSPPTPSELQRIERKFWLFELYCNLFRQGDAYTTRVGEDRFSPEEQKAIFLDHFTAFENEQLGCVHDYLWDQVSLAFDDVAAHDLGWAGEWSIEWIIDYYVGDPSWKEALISQGLAKITEMKNAKTYEARSKLTNCKDRYCPDLNDSFLVQALFEGFMDDNGVAEELENMTMAQAKEASKSASYIEPDQGPFEAWKWAYEKCYANCYFYSENWFFRQRAYVMWNSARLASWGLFETRREDISQEINDAWRPNQAAEEEQAESLRLRKDIHSRGGRGWWSRDDHSKISWPD